MKSKARIYALILAAAPSVLAQQTDCNVAPGQPGNPGFSTPRVKPWACHTGPTFTSSNIKTLAQARASRTAEFVNLGGGVYSCQGDGLWCDTNSGTIGCATTLAGAVDAWIVAREGQFPGLDLQKCLCDADSCNVHDTSQGGLCGTDDPVHHVIKQGGETRYTCAPLTQTYGHPEIGCPARYSRIGPALCESETAPLEDARIRELGGKVTRNGDGNITSVEFGGSANAIASLAAGRVYTVDSFDTAKRPTQITLPSGNVVTFTYDSNSTRIRTKTVAAGKVATYTYDAQGNVITVTSPEGHIYKPQYATDATKPSGKRLTYIKVDAGVPALSGQPVKCGIPLEEQVAALVDKPTLFAKIQSWMDKELTFNAVQPPWRPHTRIMSNGPLLKLEWQPATGQNIDLLDPFEPAMAVLPDVCQALTPAVCRMLYRAGNTICWKEGPIPSPKLWNCLHGVAVHYIACIMGGQPIPDQLEPELFQ